MTNEFVDFIFRDFPGPIFSNLPQNYFLDEDDKSYNLCLDVPGIKKEDLSIELINNILTIKAEYTKHNKKQKYTKQVSLPDTIDTSSIQPKLENGILHIAIYKKEKNHRLIKIN